MKACVRYYNLTGWDPVAPATINKTFLNLACDQFKLANKDDPQAVSLVSVGGVYEILVTLNDVLKINVILDSGASEVSIALDVALTLLRTGAIEKSDWLEGKVYRFADGSTARSERFKLKSVTIGNRTLRNITCSIANSIDAPMLLGQSVLKQLGKYTIDYKKGVMQFE